MVEDMIRTDAGMLKLKRYKFTRDLSSNKWSPAEALLWIQLGAFPQYEGSLLLETVHDLCRWRSRSATIAQRSYGREWQRLLRELGIEEEEATLVLSRASEYTLGQWESFPKDLDSDG